MKIPVWGTAGVGEIITVEINDQRISCLADQHGSWKLFLDPSEAGGPYDLRIISRDTITFKNVMFGEVWLCSGQSNMEMPLGGWGCINNYQQEIANANYPQIRLLTVEKSTSITPLDTLKTKGWKVCSPEAIEDFSSAGYFFGLNLFKKLNVPIGLINSSYAGTVAEAWVSDMGLKPFPEFDSVVNYQKQNNLTEETVNRNYDNDLENWFKNLGDKDAGNKNSWLLSKLKPSQWSTMKLPANWENAGLPFFDGVVWFKKVVNIPRKYAGKDITLSIGAVDDVDLTYFNDYKAGSSSIWDLKRHYIVPGKYIKAGKNIITVKVLDTGAGGGLWGPADEMKITFADNTDLSISGEWYYNIGTGLKSISFPPSLPQFHNRPTVLYNAMIAPIIPFAIKGVIWYQGESNTDRAIQYRQLMPSLINDWRNNWEEGNFPFIITQLSNFGKPDTEPIKSDWAELREAQAMTAKLDNNFIAITIDIGAADDIHPKNKQEVGRRLSLVALEKVYKEKIISSGPTFKSMNKEGNSIRIIFDDIAEGLIIKDSSSSIKGFTIAGEDHKFYYADARIVGNTIIISSSRVSDPLAVRYLWSDNPECNLYNSEWLPAAPFRTDDWK